MNSITNFRPKNIPHSNEPDQNLLRKEVESHITNIFKRLEVKSQQNGYQQTDYEKLADKIATFADKLLISTEKPSAENAKYVQGMAADLLKYVTERPVLKKLSEAIVSILSIATAIIKDKNTATELTKALPFTKALLVFISESDPAQRVTLANNQKSAFSLDPSRHKAYHFLEARFEALTNIHKQISSLATEPSPENEEKAKLLLHILYSHYLATEQISMAIIGELLCAEKDFFWNTASWQLEELLSLTLALLQKLCPGWEAGKYKIAVMAAKEWSDEDDAIQQYVELEEMVLTYQQNQTEKNKNEINLLLEGLEVIFEEDGLQHGNDSPGRKIIKELMVLEGQKFLDKWKEVSKKLVEICTPSPEEKSEPKAIVTKEQFKNKLSDSRILSLTTGLKLIEKALNISLKNQDHNSVDGFLGELAEHYSESQEDTLLYYLLTAMETDTTFRKHIETHLGRLKEMTLALLANKPSTAQQNQSEHNSQLELDEKASKKRKLNSHDDEWEDISE